MFTTLGDKYTVVDGSHSADEQTTTLTVKGALNTEDTAYTCVITPDGTETDAAEKSKTVNLNVYSKF